MARRRFAFFGAGFWAPIQLSAWGEITGVECVAIYNRTRSKAEALAARFGIPSVYDSAEELLRKEKVDFVDIATSVETHAPLTLLAAKFRRAVLCQKPMAPTLPAAVRMVEGCRRAGVPLCIHENWRWQRPIRELKKVLDSGRIGQPFRARIEMVSGFPVFENQPFLAELEQFIVTDMGTHLLDTARFLFGEAENLYCQIGRVHPQIRGEDVATVLMRMGGHTTVAVLMGYPGNPAERDRFPETFIYVEGAAGTAEIAPDFLLRVTTASGTHSKRLPSPRYAWADPAYDVVQAAIVPCHRNLLDGLEGRREAETTGADNLKTLRLVFAAYESARSGRAVTFRAVPDNL